MSGKLNKQEQIQVVIRIKPVVQQSHHSKTVYLSQEQQRTLVVQTPNKKEYFVFDSIADETCTQEELYEQIGRDALLSSTQGYNCCVFAYGQTGSGKTHSILGATKQIAADIYSQTRGILPRLLGDIFSWCQAETDKWSIKCSYMQIYNEQIYDLLNAEGKLSQIRQDLKKGVYVQGLSEEDITNYEEAMCVLLKGVKNRKVFATSMNTESSRSHTIFTLSLQTQIKEEDTIKTRKSKINIVDLAGSERAKQTKVQGDRLKQGCNINKSLHVLGNVINALVESSKKKKHIPFRDSKLTYYLKDSLSGNSITKLLANIHPSKMYLGDTLSTLMFAKRAKILKMKVEVNENIGQNFQELRKEIRKLRQELKEARYIKNQQKIQRTQTDRSIDDQLMQSWEKIIDTSGFDYAKNQNALQVFQENEINYKTLIEIYQEHIKVCSQQSGKRKSNNMHHEWKTLQRKNQAYKNLLKNVPAFTKIFKENIQMRSQIVSKKKIILNHTSSNEVIHEMQSPEKKSEQTDTVSKATLLKMKEEYEHLLKEIETKFMQYIEKLQIQYNELEHENSMKDARIKDLCRRKELPPDMEELMNENQYLKLNVMELENDVMKLADKQTKYQIEIKQLKKNHQKVISSSNIEKPQPTNEVEIEGYHEQISNKIHEIQHSLEHQLREFQKQRQETHAYIQKLKQYAIKLTQDCKSYSESIEQAKTENRNLKRKINSLLKIDNELQIANSNANNQLNTFWTNEQSNFSEEFEFFTKEKIKEDQPDQEKKKIEILSEEIVKVHQSYGNEITKLKSELREIQKQKKQLYQENCCLCNQIRNLQKKYDDFSSPSHTSIQPSKGKKVQKHLIHSKSYKSLAKLQTNQGPQRPDQLSHNRLNYMNHKTKSILKIKQGTQKGESATKK